MEPARVTLALAMLTCGPIGFKLTLRESKSIHTNVNRAGRMRVASLVQ